MIVGGFFVWRGVNQVVDRRSARGALVVAGGLSVMTGIRPRQALGVLVAFLIPESLETHRFWEARTHCSARPSW